jgi:hypothetical protein
MWNKEFIINDQKTIYDFQSIKYHSTKSLKITILNEYMQNIHLGFDEVWKYLAKCVMENHYSCNRLKNVMWLLILTNLF